MAGQTFYPRVQPQDRHAEPGSSSQRDIGWNQSEQEDEKDILDLRRKHARTGAAPRRVDQIPDGKGSNPDFLARGQCVLPSQLFGGPTSFALDLTCLDKAMSHLADGAPYTCEAHCRTILLALTLAQLSGPAALTITQTMWRPNSYECRLGPSYLAYIQRRGSSFTREC